MGAAGRDFHDFNTHFRNNPRERVVCFTATQIPNIEGRRYPAELAGPHYPTGIPIYAEKELPSLIKKYRVDTIYLSYSDLSHIDVMHKASTVLASGANFAILGPRSAFLHAAVPVIAVCAVRTGSGKSQTSRYVAKYYKNQGARVVVLRHPMPYGDLRKQAVQRFATYADLDAHKCTIEEREEYEPHIANGIVVYAGIDYQRILDLAEREADIIIWDGGNNDIPFIKPNLHIVVVDPHRAGHEIKFHPGETNFRMADVLIINKIDSAQEHEVKVVEKNIKLYNPDAVVIKAESLLCIDSPQRITGARVLVIEDGPTLTHGGMTYGAGMLAAKRHRASEIVDAQKYAAGSIKDVYKKYPALHKILPAMGYGKAQVADLEKTINRAKCDIVVDASPVDISRILKVNKPVVSVRYELAEVGNPKLPKILSRIKIKRQSAHLGIH
ncbi:GTPase [Candidatus Woesearchaeota archaeon]|nr:GTPase [Candidatus Woesearchaeota archaeon]